MTFPPVPSAERSLILKALDGYSLNQVPAMTVLDHNELPQDVTHEPRKASSNRQST
jgi:hypothetical protein